MTGASPRAAIRKTPPVALLLPLAACLEYSPHAIPMDDDETAIHARALERLLATPEPDVLRFVVVGDTQGDFDEVEDLVASVNRIEGLSLVIQVGDFTHQGTAPEYEAMNRLFQGLRVPYFVVVGNHDLLANGGDIYDHMFGARNLAFTYARTRFVLFDSNAVEYGYDGTTPDLALIREALAPRGEYDQAILATHFNPDGPEWDAALRGPYFDLLSELGVKASFYGHDHGPHEFDNAGSRFYLPGSMDYRTFIVATVQRGGAIEVQRGSF
jgi:predicted phosphodiesterase